MKKRIFTIVLAMSMLITSLYTSSEAVYASDLAEEIEQSKEEQTSGTEEAEPETTEQEQVEPESTEPESAEPEMTEPESTEPESAELETAEPETTEQESVESEAAGLESDVEAPEEKSVPEEMYAAGNAPLHTMSKIYWNPNGKNTVSGTGSILQYAGNDSNSGSTVRYPVLNLTTAIERAAAGADIFCMNYYGCNSDTVIDAGDNPVTIKRDAAHKGNIVQITDGILELANLTLDGSDSYEDRVLTVGRGATLKIGDSVGNVGESFYFIEATANAVVLAGEPEAGTKYNVEFAAGFFEKGKVTVQATQTEEVLLVDATLSGLDPAGYFSVKNLPDGWAVYQKGKQIWAKKPIVPVPEKPYAEIWVDGENGNDSNSGRSRAECVRTWERAYQLYVDKLGGKGTIYVAGTITVDKKDLTVEKSVIERAENFDRELFCVTSDGSLEIQDGVVFKQGQKTEEEEEEEEGTVYAITGEGALQVAKSVVIPEVMRLENHDHPLELTGSGNQTFRIEAAGNYADGDLIVKNGVPPVVALELGNYCLKAQGADSYLYIPPVVYINGAAGNDSMDGLSVNTAVLTLERATELALLYGTSTLAVLGGPVTISDGSSKTLESYLFIQNVPGYSGDIFHVKNGTININGKVLGNTTADGTGKVVFAGREIKGDVSVLDNASFEIGAGTLKGTVAVSKNAAVTQSGGKIKGLVTMTGGSYTIKSGTVVGDILQTAGNPATEIKGGLIKGKVDVSAGTVLMTGGTIQKQGIVISGTGSCQVDGGTIEKCITAVRVTEGMFFLMGGSIAETNTNGLVIEENGGAKLSGGTVSAASAVKVSGQLWLSGTPEITSEIELCNKQKPVELDEAIPEEYRYTLSFSGDYLEEAGTSVAVNGKAGCPATLSQFSITEDASELLELSERGDNLEITKKADPVGIYWGKTPGYYTFGGYGEEGNDSNSGTSPTDAVVTFERVKELLLERYDNGNGEACDVYVSGGVRLADDFVFEFDREKFPWNPKIIRYPGYKQTMFLMSGNVTMQNITIDGNDIKQLGGCAIDVSGKGLTIEDGVVLQNVRGGVIRAYNATLKIEGGTIRDIVTEENQQYTSVIYADEGKLLMSGGTIQNCEVEGAVLHINEGSAEISGGTIQNNITRGNGPVAATWYSTVRFTGGTIQNNEAVNGGALYLADKANVSIEGGTYVDNHASKGGAVYCYGADVEISGGVFEGNSADYGGAMYMTSFRFNQSPYNIFLASDFTMGDNVATVKGDGIYVEQTQYNRTNHECMTFGSLENEQTIYLGKYVDVEKVFPIGLTAAITDPSTLIEIEVDPVARPGDVVVVGDGTNVTNAAQYVRNFTISPESGYTLVPSGKKIILGQAYYVDGVSGDDGNAGNRPGAAFKTMERAIEALGSQAGSIYVCGTVTIPAGTSASWTLNDTQSIVRYSGIDRKQSGAFTGRMIVVEENAALNLQGVNLYGALAEDEAEENDYLLVQNGTLTLDENSSCANGIVYLADEKVINVKGTPSELLATVEKENAKLGDVIGKYDTPTGGNTDNFSLSSNMTGFGLIAEADEVKLADAGNVYVDGLNGDDGNDGLTPQTPVRTMEEAYRRLAQAGGNIYVVDTVPVTADTTLAKTSYVSGAVSIKTTGAVQILRYDTNQNPLLKVRQGILKMSGVTVDGAKSAAGESQSALIYVEAAGTLELEGGAVLKNNRNAGDGGAIYNEGTVRLRNCTIRDNEASRGAGVCHAGAVLAIADAKAGLSDNEIYLSTQKYIQVEAILADGCNYSINLDSADATAGRTIAVFDRFTYSSAGVAAEAEHFAVSEKATKRVLEAKGQDTLVLAGDFDVTLSRTEFFAEAETEILFNAVPQNARASQVQVSVKKDGKEIICTTKDYNRYKQIQIPAEEKNVGTLTVTFTCGNTSVEKEIVLSTYAVVYQDGADALIARPQETGVAGVHRDSAWLHICNGAGEEREFAIGDIFLSYEDGSEVEWDNNKISADMENAMSCFGIEIEPVTEIGAGQQIYIPIELCNGNAITMQKKGDITLADVTYGDNWTSMTVDFVTKPVTRVRVQLNLDDEPDYNAKVEALEEKTGRRIRLTCIQEEKRNLYAEFRRLFQKGESYQYEAEGLAEGSYRILVDEEDTGQSVDLSINGSADCVVDRYHISYEANGGTFAQDAPELYIRGKGIESLPRPEKENAEFAGWYTKKDLTGEPIASITETDEGKMMLYAAWKERVEDFEVNILQKSYFAQDGSAVTVSAAVEGCAPEDVMAEVAAPEGTDITDWCDMGTSGNCRTITVPIKKEHVGTYRITFSQGTKKIEKDVILSAYVIQYAKGQDALIAEAQEDGVDEIHTDTASVTVYNGYDKPQVFQAGKAEIFYNNSTETAQISNLLVEKNMEPANTMKYFGLHWDAESREVPAGGQETFGLTLSNGDRLTDTKEGVLRLQKSSLGEDVADINLALRTRAITRLQVAGTYDDGAKEDLVITLCQNGSTVYQLENIIGEHPTAGQWYRAATGKLSLRYNYQITGIGEGTYDLFVNGRDCGRKITITAGKVRKETIALYSIEYDTGGGTLPQDAGNWYIAGVRQSLPVPAKDGYEFGGWYLSDSLEGESMDAIEKECTGALVLHARWNMPVPVYAVTLQPVQTAPVTADTEYLIYDIALIGGITILMRMFLAEQDSAMDEEEKERLIRDIIRKARGKGMAGRLYALFKIFVILLFYYTLGEKYRCQKNAE